MLIHASWMPSHMLLPDICYTCSKTSSIFIWIFSNSDQMWKSMSLKRPSYCPAGFQVLGISCKSQDNFQTNYVFPSHISGRFHWVALKPVVCWQEFLWAHLSNLFSFRGMFFSPMSVWVTLFLLILPELSQAKLHATFLITDVNFTLNLTPHTLLLLGFLEDAIRVNHSHMQSYQLWGSGMNYSGMNGSSL